jgi:diguanylate cyclase (GGDEF)-like protein/PAS domain S-box-containing protein
MLPALKTTRISKTPAQAFWGTSVPAEFPGIGTMARSLTPDAFLALESYMIETLDPTIISRLIEGSPDAVLIMDDRSRIRYLNPAMQALSGFAPAELLGQALEGLLPAAPAAAHDGYMRHYIDGNKPSSVLGKVREFAIRHRTGEMIPIELKAFDLGVTQGCRIFGAFMTDLRPRKRLEAQHAALVLQLEQQALSDSLTGLPNRRAFEAEAASMMARAQRTGGTITVGLADIDHFKRVNDEYGHATGDAVLCRVARIVRDTARNTDFVGRIGGEEFGLLFPDATLEQATRVAERIRSAVVAAYTDGMAASEKLKVTVSIGLAWLPADGALDAALANADAALYEAKHKGRNRVEIS